MAIMKTLGEQKGGCFPPNTKRPRIDAVQDIPVGCGSFKAQNRDAIVKPSDNDDHGKKIDKVSVPFSHSSSICAEFVNTIPAKNCPPPTRKLKKLLVERDFPQGCGRLEPSSCKNSGVGSGNFKEKLSVDCVDDKDIVNCNKVKKALDAYQVTLTNILQECESNLQNICNPYVAAAIYLRKQGKWVNTRKQLGSIPGVKVGDKFHYRAELPVVGLHGPFESGIDYMMKDGITLATSVVASGRYPNNVASFDTLIYIGQGGNPLVTKGKPKDQTLERGNLALKNSKEARTPVRVIRGFKWSKPSSFEGTRAKTVIAYVYDGLYLVDDFWVDQRGTFGKLVFKFLLRRILGQPKLTCGKAMDKLMRSKVSHNIVFKNDISQGKEKMPIRVVNEIDDESPPSFNYITNVIYPDYFKLTIQTGCGCTDGCSESKPCPCVMKNGGVLPYKCNGCLKNVKSLVYECGTSCMCSSSCKNRVSQHGIHFELEVFKTKSKGWGVRSRSYIPSGSFVCEYTGEILQEEVNRRLGSDECLFGTKGNQALQDRCQPFFFPMLSSLSEEDRFTINASQHGNVGRFVNHSCSPNLCVQNVLYDHDDKRMPHTMLFAMKNIRPLQELTYDHNYILS